MMHEVIVGCSQDFVTRLECQAVVYESQPLRRTVGESHFVRVPANIFRGAALHPRWKGLLLRLVCAERLEAHTVFDSGESVGIKHATVPLNGLPNLAWMRHEVEL